MTGGFNITTGPNTITVETESFTLVFNKARVGISSFRYRTGDIWHECVEDSSTPAILFSPHFVVADLPGDLLYPSGGASQSVEWSGEWFASIKQSGYLRNSVLVDSTDFTYEVVWSIWPSGRIGCRMKMVNECGESQRLTEEAYRLNPADDPDINLGRDDAPSLRWFGFYSNNTGGGESDLSHDAIVVPFERVFNRYAVDGNTNRVFRETYEWAEDEALVHAFMLALSVSGSWGDCTGSQDFQDRGDFLCSDYLNPDPLDGSENAGEVIVGIRVGDGFDEELPSYTVVTE